MEQLEQVADSLPESWKWLALFVPPQPHEAEWRRWLAEAQRAEEEALLRFWGQRTSTSGRADPQERTG